MLIVFFFRIFFSVRSYGLHKFKNVCFKSPKVYKSGHQKKGALEQIVMVFCFRKSAFKSAKVVPKKRWRRDMLIVFFFRIFFSVRSYGLHKFKNVCFKSPKVYKSGHQKKGALEQIVF